jgi:hypothetical protein
MNWKAFESSNDLLFWHMPEGTKENHKKYQSRQLQSPGCLTAMPNH